MRTYLYRDLLIDMICFDFSVTMTVDGGMEKKVGCEPVSNDARMVNKALILSGQRGVGAGTTRNGGVQPQTWSSLSPL